MTTYQGSCHCGKIAYEVTGEIEQVIECNCSICSKKGYLLWAVEGDAFKLLTPESDVSTYTFNKHVIKHGFCGTCGCGTFGRGVSPKSGNVMVAINVRCLADVDTSKLKIAPFDGASL